MKEYLNNYYQITNSKINIDMKISNINIITVFAIIYFLGSDFLQSGQTFYLIY